MLYDVRAEKGIYYELFQIIVFKGRLR